MGLVEGIDETGQADDEASHRPVVVLAYDGTGADEAGAIVEILTSAHISVVIASVEATPVTTYHGELVPQQAAAEVGRIHALVVPGGMGVRTAARNPALLGAIRQLAEQATWLGATSTGSVLLAAAGLADNARVTTHWLAGDMMSSDSGRAIEVVNQPFVEYGRLLTAGGLASTATLAFRLIGAIAGTEAEKRARHHYTPSSSIDDRYRRRARGWSRTRLREIFSVDRWGRKRLVDENHPMDPTGRAEIVVIDLDHP